VEDIKPLLAKKCVVCHGGKDPAARYDLSSWRGLFGPGTDRWRNAVAGDRKSKLLVSLGGAHQLGTTTAERDMLSHWVVKDRMAYFRSSVHPPGWLYAYDRNSRAFHGGELRRQAWDPAGCRPCHGPQLRGGTSGRSCQACHSGGPFAGCTTCHGASPPPDLSWNLDPATSVGVGAHRAHLASQITARITCKDCHRVPGSLLDTGHLFDDQNQKISDLRAEVTFSPRAGQGGVAARYDSSAGRCTVYCHGSRLKIPAKYTWPDWATEGSDGCTSCHSAPAKHHGGADCSQCHQQVVSSCSPGDVGCFKITGKVGQRFKQVGLHIDGKVQVGRAAATSGCDPCHGSGASGAPPPDLNGRTDILSTGVGLHGVHLKSSDVRVALPCSTCHTVPKSTYAKGHMDSDLPAEVVFDALANGKKRDPKTTLKARWDPKTKTCVDVYCHSRPKGKVGSVWRWTSKLSGGLVCDSCHKGKPQYPITYCVVCHPSMFSDGKINITEHIDGKLDFL